jgi:hypothetical protein
MRIARFLLAVIVIFAPSITIAANNGISPTSVKVFALLPDARSGALAGAYTAVSDDAGCLNYNPAGLALIDHCEIPAQTTMLFNKINQYSAGFVYSLRDLRVANLSEPGTIAFVYNTFDQGYYPTGDAKKNFVSNPKAKGELLSGSYGVTILDDEYAGAFRLGINAKMYKEEILNTEYSWHAYDAGFLWNKAHSPLTFGASIQNTNKDIHNPERDSELPQTCRAGVGYGFFNKQFTLSSDYIKPISDNARYAVGAEYNLAGPIILRAGYKSDSINNNNLTGGIGICLKQVDLYFIYAREICIDYAYTSFVDSGDVQYCSVIIKLGAD